jgi:DNA/RNA-binding domain of Phe-tRNA-synthetase-like protein
MEPPYPVSLDDGWIDAELAAEFPELKLRTVAVACRPGASPPGLREQLRHVSDRMNGAKAIKLRRDPVPSAYRVFYRLVGLDPDQTLTPVEQAARGRLFHGDYRAGGLVEDTLLLSLVETGVPVYAFDEDRLAGPLGLRPAARGERLGQGEYDPDLLPGRLVLADPERPVAVLFGAGAPESEVTRATRRVRLVAVGVEGVPAIHVEEALFGAAELLQGR